MNWSDVSCTPRALRQFAALWIVFFLALAGWQGLALGRPTLGLALAALAMTIGPLGLLRPTAIKPVYLAWMAAVFPIGWLASLIALGCVYYALVTPLALAFRLMGRDPLRRRRPGDAETCWRARNTPDDPQRYLRQF